MKSLLVITTFIFLTGTIAAGEPIPPRYQALQKTPGTKLLRVRGAGELPTLLTRTSDISADGKLAAYIDLVGATEEHLGDTRVLLWDVPQARFRAEFLVPGQVTALAFSPDRATLLLGVLTADAKKKPVHTVAEWDSATGKRLRELGKHDDPIFTLAFSPRGDQALSACARQVKCWTLPKGTLRKTITWPGRSESIAAAFLPDGDKILCAFSHTLRLMDLTESDPAKAAKGLVQLTDHRDLIVSVAVSADGKTAVSGSADATIRSWNLVQGKQLHVLKKDVPAGRAWISLALAEDGKSVLSCWADASRDGPAILSYWDALSGKEHWSSSGNYRGAVPMHIRAAKGLVGGGGNVLALWDLARGTVERTWGGHKAPVTAVGVDRKGRLYSADQDGFVHVWDQGQIIRSIAAHTEPILAMTLNANETQLFTASADRTVKVWEVATGKRLQVLAGHTGSVTSIVLGKDGKRAYTGSADRTIKVWDLEADKPLATWTGHSEGVNAVALAADESWLASGGDDSTIRVWPIKNDQIDPTRDAILLDQHKKAVTCLAFSRDGATLVSGSQDNTLKVWNWSQGNVTRTISGHKNWITSFVFADANTLLSTSDDLSICRWDLASGEETGQLDFGAIGDCPRCLAMVGTNRFVVGTSNWMLLEWEMGRKK